MKLKASLLIFTLLSCDIGSIIAPSVAVGPTASARSAPAGVGQRGGSGKSLSASRAGTLPGGPIQPQGWTAGQLMKWGGIAVAGGLTTGAVIGGVMASNKIKQARKEAEAEAARQAEADMNNQCDTETYTTVEEALKFIEDCKKSSDTENAPKWIEYHQKRIQEIQATKNTAANATAVPAVVQTQTEAAPSNQTVILQTANNQTTEQPAAAPAPPSTQPLPQALPENVSFGDVFF